MPTIQNQKNFYQLEKEYILFVILHPITRDFYVHFTSARSTENIYKEHYTLRNVCTKNLFKEHRYTLYPPEMYILNNLTTTPSVCYTHQIAWIKYFIDHHYNCLNISDDVSASENLFDSTEKIYESIKNKNIEDVINIGTRVNYNYGRKHMQHDPSETVIVNFKATSEERELIRKKAKLNEKTLGAYLLELGLTGHVFEVDYKAIREHTEQLSIIKNQINSIVKMLVSTGEATPSEINKIIELLEEIRDTENKLLKKVQKEQTARMEKIKKTIKEL